MGEAIDVTGGDSRANRQSASVSEVIVAEGPEHRPTAASEMLRAEAGVVQAESVTMERSGAETITAERLVMTNSGARDLNARSAQVDRSGILVVQSEKAVFQNSTILAAATTEARLVRGNVLFLKAGDILVEGPAKIGVLAGPGCNAVRPLVDLRGAAVFGAVAGAVAFLLGAATRRASGRR
jgi:hypothetical protein